MTRLQDTTTKVFTDHNVYILGAGFSVDGGIPVLSDFLYQMRLSLNHLKKEHRVQEFQATGDVLQSSIVLSIVQLSPCISRMIHLCSECTTIES